jgi:phosphoribosylaminoimidazole (AIR) synthetase
MSKCGICGGEAPRQPCITEQGKCDLCGKKVVLAEEKEEKKEK